MLILKDFLTINKNFQSIKKNLPPSLEIKIADQISKPVSSSKINDKIDINRKSSCLEKKSYFRSLQMIQVGNNKRASDVERFAEYITKIKPSQSSLESEETNTWVVNFEQDLGKTH